MSSWQFVSQISDLGYIGPATNVQTDSETAKAMMIDYHIGSLSEEDRLALAEGEAQPMPSAEPATYFL
jgi:hypothetical protein